MPRIHELKLNHSCIRGKKYRNANQHSKTHFKTGLEQ